MIHHPIEPIYDKHSRILILGSFPSVMSRETGFYYGHPQNRFWRVIASVLEYPVPISIDEKKSMLLENKIALWDVINSCNINGSSDSSISCVEPNKLEMITDKCDIQHIFLNGRTAEKYFRLYNDIDCFPESICLPSTSPANAAWTIDKLTSAWRLIRV